MSATGHAALNYPKETRMDYLRALAALVGEDSQVGGRELGVLTEYCSALQVTPEETDLVLRFTRNVDPKAVIESCERLRDSELRFTLISDMLLIAHTDSSYGAAERQVIEQIARMLGISWLQIESMEGYATAVLRDRISKLPNSRHGDDADRDFVPNLAGGVVAVTLPLVAVFLMGGGLGPVAVYSGLSHLGLHSIGLGVVVAGIVGVVGFFATRTVLRAITPA